MKNKFKAAVLFDLKKPLNFVEKKSDPNLTWRKTVNNSLKNNQLLDN